MKIILKIALLFPPRLRSILKARFPNLANLVLAQSSSLVKWNLKQGKLRAEYDIKAESMQIAEVSGVLDSLNEVVIVTPTPPIKSGITNYSSKLVAELNKLVRVKVVCSFLNGEENYFETGMRATFPEESTSKVRRKIIYMLGNGEHHWRSWDLLLNYPGYIIIHDARIPDIPLMSGEDIGWYDLSYQEKADRYMGRTPSHSLGIFCHSKTAADLVRSQFRDYQIRSIPIQVLKTGHPVEPSGIVPRTLSKKPLIGTFGFQTQNKNPQLTYIVISRIAAKVNGKGIICGKIDKRTRELAMQTWIEHGNLLGDLEIHDWVDETTYSSLMSQVTLGVQLRSSSNGESSGPFSELTSLGIPTIVTDMGTFSEFPNSLSGIFKLPGEISEMDLDRSLLPTIQLLKSPARYLLASSELIDFYQGKTYEDLAQELISEIFR
jgi:hypothetical protein